MNIIVQNLIINELLVLLKYNNFILLILNNPFLIKFSNFNGFTLYEGYRLSGCKQLPQFDPFITDESCSDQCSADDHCSAFKEKVQAYASESQIKLGHSMKNKKIMFFQRTVHAVYSYTPISFRKLWIRISSWR
ncbi:hypothetical protein T11_16464 [Trichinella zimbabwensis]|uniref:Apple domain-containing protein n=1 Tax=Trichinella zimbabwensis TaxID=268475 RepID=A0A0V1H4X7_9BILA|nr:hypothetical protein T11_16464 [Trichinella zimbabwensis]